MSLWLPELLAAVSHRTPISLPRLLMPSRKHAVAPWPVWQKTSHAARCMCTVLQATLTVATGRHRVAQPAVDSAHCRAVGGHYTEQEQSIRCSYVSPQQYHAIRRRPMAAYCILPTYDTQYLYEKWWKDFNNSNNNHGMLSMRALWVICLLHFVTWPRADYLVVGGVMKLFHPHLVISNLACMGWVSMT